MSARGRKAQLIPAGIVIASELEQDHLAAMEDMENLEKLMTCDDYYAPDCVEPKRAVISIYSYQAFLKRRAAGAMEVTAAR